MRNLLIALFLISSAAGAAPAAGVALAPMSTAVAEHATGFMEWIFNIRFTPEQRDRYHRILAATWNGSNQGAIDAVSSMARTHGRLASIPEAERTAMRERMRGEFVRLLEKAEDADSRWLLSVCTAPARGTASPLTGRWSNGRVSSIQYQDRHTGAPAPVNGNTFAYEFREDGTYSFTGLMQSVMYNCTTSIFSNETGRFTISGGTVSLEPERNPFRMTNSCSQEAPREGPGKLVQRSFRFRVVDGQLNLVGADGAIQVFSRSR